MLSGAKHLAGNPSIRSEMLHGACPERVEGFSMTVWVTATNGEISALLHSPFTLEALCMAELHRRTLHVLKATASNEREEVCDERCDKLYWLSSEDTAAQAARLQQVLRWIAILGFGIAPSSSVAACC